MEIVVTGRHTQIKQRFRDVVESKMNRVTAIAPDAQRVQIVLSHEAIRVRPTPPSALRSPSSQVVPWCVPKPPAPTSSARSIWLSTS